mmetsp:Transcript_68130/g.121417  ORF Transcript_68130/g.121417 Transcript_68130/m.121417 type:complete len:142 (+) Transcript_68130:162-587(+)
MCGMQYGHNAIKPPTWPPRSDKWDRHLKTCSGILSIGKKNSCWRHRLYYGLSEVQIEAAQYDPPHWQSLASSPRDSDAECPPAFALQEVYQGSGPIALSAPGLELPKPSCQRVRERSSQPPVAAARDVRCSHRKGQSQISS